MLKIPMVLDGCEIRLIDESFLSRPLSLSELLRVKVAALWRLAPRLHRVTRWDQNVPAGEIGRLKCRGHIDPSA